MSSQLRARGIVEELSGAFAGARGLLSNILDLFTLEARRAGLTLVLMLACGAIGAILVVAAWLGLMAALALWAVAHGISWEAAVAAVAFANLAVAGALFWLCARVSRDLLFSATRRQLRPNRLELV
ncbi:MAG TPA: phage holin family protein [Burkholderiales bacterium]|nr:phage holin family protein [Burkholderiales bacterium]